MKYLALIILGFFAFGLMEHNHEGWGWIVFIMILIALN